MRPSWPWLAIAAIAAFAVAAFVLYAIAGVRTRRARRRARPRAVYAAHREATPAVTAATATAGTAAVVAGVSVAALLPTPPVGIAVLRPATVDTGSQPVTPLPSDDADMSWSATPAPASHPQPVASSSSPAAPAATPAAPVAAPAVRAAPRHLAAPSPSPTRVATAAPTRAPAPARTTTPATPAADVAPVSGGKGLAAALFAHTLVGDPYRWGGDTPAGFDCSGLTSYVYAHLGITIPRTAHDQQRFARYVPPGDARAGDLVFYGDPAYHVGIYLGNGLMVAAPSGGRNVLVEGVSWGSHTFGRVA